MTRMHAVELVCTVALALVLLASARDVKTEDPAVPTTSTWVEPMAGASGVVNPATAINAGVEPSGGIVSTPTVMSTLSPTSGPTSVGVNGEVCVDIPTQCQMTSGTSPVNNPGVCVENGGQTQTNVKYAAHLKQFCVARSNPLAVPDPSAITLTCPWTLPAFLPSWCTWPGISCRTSYTTSYQNNCPWTTPTPCPTTAVANYGCPSGVYIYSVHQSGTGNKERQGFWASGFEDNLPSPTFSPNPLTPPPTCPSDTGYCLPVTGFPSTLPAARRGFGAPVVTAVPGQRYKIEVPRIDTNNPSVALSTYVCNIGVDGNNKRDVIRCNIPGCWNNPSTVPCSAP